MVFSYSYRRQVPGFPSLAEQQHQIHAFALAKNLKIDKEVVEYATKNLLLDEREEFEEFLRSMQDGNTVIVSSLSILSDRTEELVKVINCMLTHDVNLWIASSDMLFNRDTKMTEVFPLLNTLRQEEETKSKQIGRPKGSKSSSKFDVYHGKIISLLMEGMSVSAIARELEVSRSSLKDYIESRNIKDLVQGVGRSMAGVDGQRGMDNVVLICPFEEKVKSEEKELEEV
jgi:DNA invertase Pin-like site-specific DNA recombinase